MQKEAGELVCAEIFAQYLKKEIGIEYCTKPPRSSALKIPSTYIDCDAILEPAAPHEPLFLQITKDIVSEESTCKIPGLKKGLVTLSALEIREAIEKKEQKYANQGKDSANVILLIQGDWPFDTVKNIIDYECSPTSIFRGVYYTSPRAEICGSPYDSWDEFVIPIKTCAKIF